MKRFALAGLVCAMAASMVSAQVDIVYTNISSSNGDHPDSVMIFRANGTDRPLALSTELFTGSDISRPVLVDVAGTPYLYWYNNFPGDAIVRATDSNGNGALDPTEMENLWDFNDVGASSSAFSPDTFRFDALTGKILLSNDSSASNGFNGIWEFTDLNGDGDYRDAGEAVRILDGTPQTATVDGVSGVSIDDIESADYDSNGCIIFYEDDDQVILKLNPTTGAITTWLNYEPGTTTNGSLLPSNPDFATVLPFVNSDMERVDVDYSTTPETWYLATNFDSGEPYIFKAQDLNGNGNVNDAGEVTLFYDGTTAAVPTMAMDDLDFFNGSVYFSHEDPGLGNGDFFELTDLNADGDAMDAGEQVLLGSLTAPNDPSMLAVTAIPAGTFGTSSCVDPNLEQISISPAGGLLQITIDQIDASFINGPEFAFVGISLTPGGSFAVAPGCMAGFAFDSLTMLQLTTFVNEFSTPSFTSNSATTNGFMVPPLPAGTTFYYTGAIVGGAPAVTQSRRVVVQ